MTTVSTYLQPNNEYLEEEAFDEELDYRREARRGTKIPGHWDPNQRISGNAKDGAAPISS